MKPILDTIFTRQARVSEKRLEICKECEHYWELLSRCNKCGCIMKFKTLIMHEKCPIDKWGPEKDG